MTATGTLLWGRPACEILAVASAGSVEWFDAYVYGRRALRLLAEAYGVTEPVLLLDYPMLRKWPAGRHAEYHPAGQGAVYVPVPNAALPRVLAHEFVHALERDGVVDRPGGQTHTGVFYRAVEASRAVLPRPPWVEFPPPNA